MTADEVDQIGKLWQAIGGVQAWADPEGSIAKDAPHTPEERLAKIWEIVQTLRP